MLKLIEKILSFPSAFLDDNNRDMNAINSAPPAERTHRAKSRDQKSPHDLAEDLFVLFSRRRSPSAFVNSRSVYRNTRDTLTYWRTRQVEGCNFDEGPRWTEARVPSRGTRRTWFPPVSSRTAHRPSAEKGTPRGQKPGNQRTTAAVRPVRSTVNACLVPPLTTILASWPLARLSTSDGLERTPWVLSSDRVRELDPKMTQMS
jgi:hypothetical protein